MMDETLKRHTHTMELKILRSLARDLFDSRGEGMNKRRECMARKVAGQSSCAQLSDTYWFARVHVR